MDGPHDRPHTLHTQTSYTNLPIIVAVMLILNQWRRSLRVRVMQIRPIQSSCYEREKRRGREREKIIAPRWNERETRREDRRENTERERISNNRVSTIKANPPATLIMVCRIDLSRSPAQTASQRHPIPVSAPSLGRSKPPRELIPVKSLIYGEERRLYGRFTAAISALAPNMCCEATPMPTPIRG